ncbi:MAG: hypothetical protein DDT19_00575 [Syntrophomonadaceae bacterium]|nr:hypothetical protein [Bacillota bacterium]
MTENELLEKVNIAHDKAEKIHGFLEELERIARPSVKKLLNLTIPQLKDYYNIDLINKARFESMNEIIKKNTLKISVYIALKGRNDYVLNLPFPAATPYSSRTFFNMLAVCCFMRNRTNSSDTISCPVNNGDNPAYYIDKIQQDSKNLRSIGIFLLKIRSAIESRNETLTGLKDLCDRFKHEVTTKPDNKNLPLFNERQIEQVMTFISLVPSYCENIEKLAKEFALKALGDSFAKEVLKHVARGMDNNIHPSSASPQI